MRVSQNEIESACQKALAAVGAPQGGARASAWLEARGFNGAIAAFAADLQDGALSPAPLCPRVTADGKATIHLRGKSLAVFAPHLVDYLAALAQNKEEVVHAAFHDARSPVFLLFAAHLWTSVGGASFFFSLQRRGGFLRAALCTPGALYLSCAFDSPLRKREDIGAMCAMNAAVLRRAVRREYPHFFQAAKRVFADEGDALENNIAISPAKWRLIKRYAARVLVPPSAKSRRQAGA